MDKILLIVDFYEFGMYLSKAENVRISGLSNFFNTSSFSEVGNFITIFPTLFQYSFSNFA